eukprot:CAMPEP_0119416914 /NCGR_PEP_ID=MMETSP1335-20130426/14437_1 /TAXON_ID=259385 /ORGANISM="Chrysoculter rhomboideus, Strain RCC1486" /LENGTH=84 /DNA_ID=CAMNT_0007442061 /DNA_START=342 /DNA_END=593 /DNA_ORIENTATION=+
MRQSPDTTMVKILGDCAADVSVSTKHLRPQAAHSQPMPLAPASRAQQSAAELFDVGTAAWIQASPSESEPGSRIHLTQVTVTRK